MESTNPRVLLTLALVVGFCWGQNGESNTNSSGVRKDPERGVIFSVTPIHDGNVHLIHLPVMPYYEPVKRPLLSPAYLFNSPDIDFLSVDVDFRDKTLFLFERDSRSILALVDYKAPVTTGPVGLAYYLNIGVSNGAVQIAYDWLSKTLYWVDSALKWVVATSGDMKRMVDTDFVYFNQFKIMVETDLQHPEGMAVDPLEGLMFVSDNGPNPKIERFNLDGTGRRTLLGRGVGQPESLEVDIVERRVYWVDAFKETIEYMNYDGTGVTRLRLIAGTLLADLGIFRDLLIATDAVRGRAHFLNKTSGDVLEPSLEFKDNYMYGVCVYNIQNQPLKQINGKNCSELACEHLCISTSTIPKCMCYEGYELDDTMQKCKESSQNKQKALVLATDRQICLADLRSLNTFSALMPLSCNYWTLYPQDTITTPRTSAASSTMDPNATTTTKTPYDPTTDPANTIKMIDVDAVKRIVYFVTGDNSIYGRPVDLPINDTYRDSIVSATGNIAGIVFDWVNKNKLYWLESDTRVINMVDIFTRSTRKVAALAGSPSNLVMLYRSRRLAWWLKSASGNQELKTMYIDGSNMNTIVTRFRTDINTLVVDDESQMFYWIEGTSVYYVPYTDGANVKRVNGLVVSTFELFLQYKNYLLWGVSTSTQGTVFHTYQTDTKTMGAQGSFDIYRMFVDVKALDISLAPDDLTKLNPCSKGNGGCDQICINKYTAATPVKACECTLGFTLQSDGTTCQSDYVTKNFALVTDVTHGRIYQIDLVNDVTHALNFRQSAIYDSVFYHKYNQEVIWTEQTSTALYAGNIDSSNEHIIDKRAIGDIGEMALDETTGNLYYADNSFPYLSSVRILTPQGHGFEILVDRTEYRDAIAAIDVHPQKGWLYVAVRSSYFASYVLRSNLDGSNITKIVLDVHTLPSRFPQIEGLVIDHTTDHIYWSDREQNAIYKCDLDLRMCTSFHSDPKADVREIDTDGEYLYYTSWNNHHLKRVSLTDGTETELGKSVELGKLESVSVFRPDSPNKQKVSKPCEARNGRGNCSTICFPTQTGRQCACESDITLLADQRTCSNVLQCDQTFMDGNRQTITMETDCLRYVNESCRYRCPVYYAPVKNQNNDVTLQCMNDTKWNRQNERLCTAVYCPHTITNGRILDSCSITNGGSCQFECTQGFYKNPDVPNLRCQNDGTWVTKGKQPCIDVLCPSSITNGQIDDQCDRRVKSSCGYRCNRNYRKTARNVMSLVCQPRGDWDQTTNLCEEVKCPASFSVVMIDSRCDRKVGSNCTFSCPPAYRKSEDVSRLTCKETGAWNITLDLCIGQVTVVGASNQKETKTVGLGVGIGVGVLVLVALVLLLVVCRKKLGFCAGKQKDVPSASFTSAPVDGIENPGFLTADIRVTDDRYDQLSIPESENNYSTISEAGSTKGLQKYFYGHRETLPEKKEIQSPQKGELDAPSGEPQKMSVSDWFKHSNRNKY